VKVKNLMPENFVKLKDHLGFKRLMRLATAMAIVLLFIFFLLNLDQKEWEDFNQWQLIAFFLIPFVFGLLIYGTFRTIYWVIDGFRQGSK